ncbi:L-aminoadipate-semialdehyde dehydrogenase-phosphopantetheinyl transferase [Tribolium castaneum]|uniref:L-aminoadipate-semialdehyde dehydrogenase-phosphopantetheinyl transferase n=1 Tax=Tribolium castaneum TaxID=7070 RepID=D6X3H4_TRICA|nr:L-aminoadipate-semialdehyde dehydrogenase-phosphopantetheinyl transferase-like Protein [Tribolium castaneum]
MSNKSVRWAFNLSKWEPSHSDMLLATSCVQVEEKERLARFVFKNDVKSSLIGRLLMRKFVNEATGLKYNEIKFARDEKGKPFLTNNNFPINYNVSHQGDYTVLAGCNSAGLLGVDVVKVEFPRGKSLGEYFRLMSRIFSGTEWEKIRGQGSEKNQLAMFCRHWCLKESYLKAVGVGVTINLQDVCFKINSDVLRKDRVVDDTEVYFRGEKLDWEFQEMLLDDQHCVAVATEASTGEKFFFKEIGFNEVMENAVALLEPDEDYCNSFFKKCDKS